MRKGGYEKITFPFFSGWWIASSGWKRIFCTQGRSVSGSIKAIAPYSVGVIAKPYSLSRAGCRWPTMEPSVKPFSVSLIRREPRSSEARWRKADWNGEAENGREATLRRQGVPCPAATSISLRVKYISCSSVFSISASTFFDFFQYIFDELIFSPGLFSIL